MTIFGVKVAYEPRSSWFVQDPTPRQIEAINDQRVWRQLTKAAFNAVIKRLLEESGWPLVGLQFSKGQASILIQWFTNATEQQIKAIEQQVIGGHGSLGL